SLSLPRSAARNPSAVPTMAPAATSPLCRKVRRLSLLCSGGSMLSIRVLMVGPAGALALAFAATAHAAPPCAPRTLGVSAVQAGSVRVSPIAGSRDASPWTQVSFLGVPARSLQRVSVSGSRTGRHSGRLLSYSQGNGASFVPYHPFEPGERVTVRARVRAGAVARSLSETFVVSE